MRQNFPTFSALQIISTHAPLARCDPLMWWATKRKIDFNSRTSCEVRQACSWTTIYTPIFQLTHLLRGATKFMHWQTSLKQISTHAPLARCDKPVYLRSDIFFNFNSRTSCEVRRLGCWVLPPRNVDFNSRTSCEVRHWCNNKPTND